ncbi:MAG: ATP-binding protein [Paludibacteraceae bacterium]|nr:ATP-binding protein [Paludibacteraceae bacterium]MBQ6984036.1 ATP-binding protein [Paludibacteraceae bacterium]
MSEKIVYPSLFEKDYILRSLGKIVTDPAVALTELVANAWDAGASHVSIFIPDSANQMLYVEDNGNGMTEDEFQKRWMTLRYDKLKDQGKQVKFPEDGHKPRIAFGRNGVGRHGLFCFADEYKVSTWRDGVKHIFTVQPNVETQPFAVVDKQEEACEGHGTRLEVIVDRHCPNVDRIREIISARFLHDPEFVIEVNNKILQLEDLCGGADVEEISVPDTGIHLKAYFIDTTKSSRKSIFHGVAIWQSGRLVGNPSWTLGDNAILDGRTALAKRYTVIVTSEDLSDYIKEDWSGFIESDVINNMYEKIEEFVDEQIKKYADSILENAYENFDTEVRQQLVKVNPLARVEMKETVLEVVKESPKVKQESINLAMKTLIKFQQSQSGVELLEKILRFDESDIEGMNAILDKWTVRDAMTVLNEVDRRLAIIEAISKLAGEETTDELHVLHPLINEARWLFGPEYESSEYIFNKQMKTAVAKIFGDDAFYNPDVQYNRRPDLICLPDKSGTIGITGIEEEDAETKLSKVRNLLLIELKKGKFKLTRNEVNQTGGYILDLLNSNLGDKVRIIGYVVGDSYDSNISKNCTFDDGRGVLYATTYSQIVDTAQRRMFNLRKILAKRYEHVPGMELYAQVQKMLSK